MSTIPPAGYRYWIIPQEVQLKVADGDITYAEALILITIDGFVRTRGEGCWASNKTIASMWGMGATRVSASIAKLERMGLVIVTREKKNDDTNEEIRYLETWYSRIESTPYQNGNPPHYQNGNPSLPKWEPSINSKELIGNTKKTLSASADAECQRSVGVRSSLNGNGHTSKTKTNKPSISKQTKQITSKTDTDSPSSKMAKKLHDALLKKNKIMRKPSMPRWVAEFSKLHQGRPLKIRRVRKVLKWYCAHFMDPYVPKCFSAVSFCSRFVSIEFAMESSKKKDSSHNGFYKDQNGVLTHKVAYWD